MSRINLPNRDLALEYESHGDPAHPAVILVMGLGMQLIAWPAALVEAIVGAGFRVIVFDNRDIGLSDTGPLREGYTPPAQAMLRHLLFQPFVPAYTLEDLARDTLALADALGIGRFHVAGVSLGGMVAQTVAVLAPSRVASLVSIMANAGPRTAPWPELKVLRRFLVRPPSGASFEKKLDHFHELMKMLGKIEDPEELASLRERMKRGLERAYRPDGTARQFVATFVEGDRRVALARIVAPTLILHGRSDPLVRPGAATVLQKAIPGAKLEVIDELGHYLPGWAAPMLGRKIAAWCAAHP